MRVPMQWLADFVDVDLPVEDLAHRLTMAGIKVETIDRIGGGWADIVVGEIIEMEPHPSSRKPLNVTKVDLGTETVTIVTGAQNIQVGDKVPVVPVGGLLPAGPDGMPMRIERRPMVGITSHGMLASARELGISDEHAGIYILPSDAPVGASLRSLLGDDVLDIETNPNRPDTLSIIGNSREAAALLEQQLSLPDLEAITGQVEWLESESVSVTVEDAALCPRYSALRIDGVVAGPSPAWLARRLEAAGMRPINVIVDLTNYVMLEYGQPMHAFDASRIAGGHIVVRQARAGETLTTLDGLVRDLTPETLVIADADRAVAIAGVMGGENSEIDERTSSIVLESATFDPVSVRRTAQSFGLRTEASSRFEKGLPPEQTVLGLRRYLQLLAQILPGPLRVHRMTDVFSAPPPERTVRMPMRDLHRLTGIAIPRDEAADRLSLLGFGVSVEGDALVARVPYWRRADVTMSADLVEEVIRLVGYDTIPLTLPRRTMAPAEPSPGLYWEGIVRERLLAAGVNEAVTKTLTSEREMERLFPAAPRGEITPERQWEAIVVNPLGIASQGATVAPVRLMNPPSRDRRITRLTLVPSLLGVVSRNLKHTDERVAFFEIARTYFHQPGELPYERRTLGIALSGKRRPQTWQETAPGPHTFYDMKGVVAAVMDALQIRAWTIEAVSNPALHPGRAAAMCVGETQVALLGELHPRVAATFEIEDWPVQVAELDLDSLFPLATRVHTFQSLPRYPAARRDIAVTVARDVPAQAVTDVILRAGGSLLESSRIFDVYAGEPLPEDRKSIAVALDFRSSEGTLTQEEITGALTGIVDALMSELGASLRE
jgi:phenylalanyl-tRNA synthetase beta chain